MTHWSEDSRRLSISPIESPDKKTVLDSVRDFNDVCLLRLPIPDRENKDRVLHGLKGFMTEVCIMLGHNSTLVIVGDVIDLVHVHEEIASLVHYQLWVTINLTQPEVSQDATTLPHNHIGALIYTKYKGQLRHTKTRLAYTYCPACHKTTKDYGGKKHTYHEYGTLISDVWRDIAVDSDGSIENILERIADLFGIGNYHELRVYDLSNVLNERTATVTVNVDASAEQIQLKSQLLHGRNL